MKTKSIWVVTAVWGAMLLCFFVGVFCTFSPLWFDGGIVGLLSSTHSSDPLGRFFENLFSAVFSIILGIVLIGTAAVEAFITGIVATVILAARRDPPSPAPQLPGAPSPGEKVLSPFMSEDEIP